MNACYFATFCASYKLTFIVDGIDDMHRGRNAAMPLRPLQMDTDVAVLITRRDATANMALYCISWSGERDLEAQPFYFRSIMERLIHVWRFLA